MLKPGIKMLTSFRKLAVQFELCDFYIFYVADATEPAT